MKNFSKFYGTKLITDSEQEKFLSTLQITVILAYYKLSLINVYYYAYHRLGNYRQTIKDYIRKDWKYQSNFILLQVIHTYA